MRDLKARGIWLLDTCVVGWYIPQATYYVQSARTGEVQRKAKERPPKRCKTPALALSWELTKHVVRAAAAAGHLKALIPIGAEVFAAIGLDRLRAAAPGAVVPGGLPGAQCLGPGRLRALLRLPLGDLRAGRGRRERPAAAPADDRPGRAPPPPAAAPSAVVTPGPAAAPAAAPSAVVTPGKVPEPLGRAPLGATWDGARGEWVHGAATPPPAPVVEDAPAPADEELTEWRAAVGDEWADWRGCICNGPYHGSMVGCDGGCDNWFHFACVGITRLPRGEFYCEECKARREAKRRRPEGRRRRRPGLKPARSAARRRRGRRRRSAAPASKKSGRAPGGRPRRSPLARRRAADAPCGAQAAAARAVQCSFLVASA